MMLSSSQSSSCLVWPILLIFFSQTLFQLPSVIANDDAIANIVEKFTENVAKIKESLPNKIVHLNEGKDAKEMLAIFVSYSNLLREFMVAYKDFVTRTSMKSSVKTECNEYIGMTMPTNVDKLVDFKELQRYVLKFGRIPDEIKQFAKQNPQSPEIGNLCKLVDEVIDPILDQLALIDDWRHSDYKVFIRKVKRFTVNVENLNEKNTHGIVQVTERTNAQIVLELFAVTANKLRQIVAAYKDFLTNSYEYINYGRPGAYLDECNTYLKQAFPTNVDEFMNFKILSEFINQFGRITDIIKQSTETAENEQNSWTREIESLCVRIDAVLNPILEQLKLVNDWRNRDMKKFLKMVRKFIENLREKPKSHGIMAQLNEGANEAEAAAAVLNAFLANSKKLKHIGLVYKNLLSEASKYYEITEHMEQCDKFNKILEHLPNNIEELLKFDKLPEIIYFYRNIANDIDTFSTVGDGDNPLSGKLLNLRKNIDEIIEPIIEESNFLEIWRKCSIFVKSYEDRSTQIHAKAHRFETVVNGIIEKATMSLASFISQEFLKRQSGLEKLKSQTCKLREELKRQSVEMPKEMAQIEAYFAFEQKVSTSQIDTMLNEYYKFHQLMGKHYPRETCSAEEYKIMELKMTMYHSIWEFLKATEKANALFMQSLEWHFFHQSVGNEEIETIMRSYTSFYDNMYLMNAIKLAKKRFETHALLFSDPNAPSKDEVEAETVNLWALGKIVENTYKKLKYQPYTDGNKAKSIFTSYEKMLEDAESLLAQFGSIRIRTYKLHWESRDEAKAKFEHQIETNGLLMKRPDYFAEILSKEWAKKNHLKRNSVDEIEHESMAKVFAQKLAISPKLEAMEFKNEEVEAASSTAKGLKKRKVHKETEDGVVESYEKKNA